MSERIAPDVQEERRRRIGFTMICAGLITAVAMLLGGPSTASGAAPRTAHTHQAARAGTVSFTPSSERSCTGSPATRGASTAPTSTRALICRSTTWGRVRPRRLHLGVQRRRVPVGGGRRPRPRVDLRGEGRSARRRDAGRGRDLKRYDGFLYQWYDTNNGDVLKNPGDVDCTRRPRLKDNCWFLSAVDNGWYATGLIEVRQALPDLRGLADPCWRRWTSASSTTTARRPTATSTPRWAVNRHRPDVRRLLRRPGAGRLPQRRPVQRSSDRDVRRDGPPPDARRCVVADVANRPSAALRHRPGAGGRSRRRLLAHLHRSAVGQAVPGVGGPLPYPGRR